MMNDPLIIIEYKGISYINFEQYVKRNLDKFNNENYDYEPIDFFNEAIPYDKKLILIDASDYLVSERLVREYNDPRFSFPDYVISIDDTNLQFDDTYPYPHNYIGMYLELYYYGKIL